MAAGRGLVVAALLSSACASSQRSLSGGSSQPALPVLHSPAVGVSTKLRWEDVRDEYLAAWLVAEPAAGRALGLHEYDGKIADYSSAAIGARVTRLRAQLARVSSVDAATLDPDAALDRA